MQAIQVRRSTSAARELVLAVILLLGFVLLAVAVISNPGSSASTTHRSTPVTSVSAPASDDQATVSDRRTTHGFLP